MKYFDLKFTMINQADFKVAGYKQWIDYYSLVDSQK